MLDFEIGTLGVRTFALSQNNTYGPVTVKNTVSTWEDGKCEAKCYALDPWYGVYDNSSYPPNKMGLRPPLHEAPHPDCKCGIYACTNLYDLWNQWSMLTSNITTIIAAEGNTIIGPRGFRTARAQVIAYAASTPRHQKAAERQFPNATPHDDIFGMIKAHNISTGAVGERKLRVSMEFMRKIMR